MYLYINNKDNIKKGSQGQKCYAACLFHLILDRRNNSWQYMSYLGKGGTFPTQSLSS